MRRSEMIPYTFQATDAAQLELLLIGIEPSGRAIQNRMLLVVLFAEVTRKQALECDTIPKALGANIPHQVPDRIA